MAKELKRRKVTITVPEDVATTLDQWREAGRIESVSGYITDTVQRRMSRDESLTAFEAAIGGRPPLTMINRARAVRGLPPLTEADIDATTDGKDHSAA